VERMELSFMGMVEVVDSVDLLLHSSDSESLGRFRRPIFNIICDL
jgi:hypothetical protein